MHRFLWSLAWASSGGPTLRAALADAQSEIAKILSNKEDLKLGRQIFVEAIEARRALAEIAPVQKQLADVQEKVRQTPSIRALPMGCPHRTRQTEHPCSSPETQSATPARRAILDELVERDGQTLYELCTRLAMKHHLGLTRQAISQPLDVLELACRLPRDVAPATLLISSRTEL